jgi:glycine betaine catabolism A
LHLLTVMTAFQKATVQRRASTLAEHYYTSTDIFRQEIQRIFSNHWLCVGRSEQIADTGDYFLIDIGAENLIILRDTAGITRAFFNVCRHRGTRLCTKAQGHFVETIQCPYHAWTYSLEGQLQAARQMQQVKGFTTKDYPLYACALHEWEGLLWVNLAPNPAPFAQTFAPLLSRFAPWGIANLRQVHQIEYSVHANWKLIFQNYSESYHGTVRSQLTRLASAQNGARNGAQSGRSNLVEGAFLGSHQDDRSIGSITGEPQHPTLPGIRGENRYRVYYYSLFPTLLLSLHPNYVITHQVFPQGAEQTRVVCEWLFDPSTQSDPNFDPSDAIDFWDLTNRQNWRLYELTQQGIGSRAYNPEPYTPEPYTPEPHTQSEGLLAAFDQEYLRVMGA